MIGPLIARAVDLGGLPVDDVVALMLPLIEQTRVAHETGRVAPLRGLDSLRVTDHQLSFTAAVEAHRNPAAIAAAERELASSAVDVRRGATRHLDLSVASTTTEVIDVDPAGRSEPRVVAGWQRWEHLLGHHDELTDIGSLGELIAALCCGLDLADPEDAETLARHADNLYALAPRLHPVVASIATSMIAPDRHHRLQDLGEVGQRLLTYRDQPEDFDLDRVLAAGKTDRRETVLNHLRDRLFDLTRRNPLLHFRATGRTLNLTQSSVPLVLDVRSIRPEQLFTWGGRASQRLIQGKTVDLSSMVRWDDAPYAAGAVDTIMATARKDRAEYGQDQLRLVTAFLRWHDVHNDPGVPVTSPLLLSPATVTKQRGVQNSYRLQLAGSDAEVNPVLRHQLRELYGFVLPTTVDLADADSIESLRGTIERQARASQPGVSLTLINKPRIELIRTEAQTRLASYRRRRGGSRPTIGRRQYPYSYRRPGWQPLGIQIFRNTVQRSPLPMRVELGDAPVPRQQAASSVTETELFRLRDGETNPYAWELDLCSVTLANFNYRTLSLVRDYEDLLATPRPNPGFDELFSAEARDAPLADAHIAVEDRYLVLDADDSQLGAIAQARAGDNFVVQGPPGTGKSQTITNLIADYVARGKRVLFVCQKRAALDVVHARLRAQGLGEICTLVHDSQQDKKAFVHGLRDTYEEWLATPADLDQVEAQRASLMAELAGVHQQLAAYDTALTTGDEVTPRPIDMLDDLIELAEHTWGADLDPADRRQLPSVSDLTAATPAIDRLTQALSRSGASRILAESALTIVNSACLRQQRPDAVVAQRATSLHRTLTEIINRARAAGLKDPASLTLDEVRRLARMHTTLAPLAPAGLLSAWRAGSPAAVELGSAASSQRALTATTHQATARAAGWHQPLGPDDTRSALAVATQREQSMWKFLNSDWKRVRDLTRTGYADPDRKVAPTVTEALTFLLAQHEATAAEATSAAQATERWGHDDLTALESGLAEIRALAGPIAVWRDSLTDQDHTRLDALDTLPSLVGDLPAGAADALALDGPPLATLMDHLTFLASPLGQALVRSAAGPLSELSERPQVLAALCRFVATPEQLRYATVYETLVQARSAHEAIDRVDGERLGELLDDITRLQPKLRRANAEVVVARLRHRFVTAVDLSRRSVSGMSNEDRELKRTWSAGRRELEHEFSKTRAYKSIRQLSDGDPGVVTAGMRPVWLVSPSSLSDTLPLGATFDVVVFDEASQVPVGEAVPALYRASQVIVVGDRMQLPPTTYFRTASDGADEGDGSGEDEDQQVGVVLNADSFLAVSSTRLPSTMLLWHYRSRFESLIQFSNAAFYDGRLATIPDRATESIARPALVVTTGDGPDPDEIARVTDAVLNRSITTVRINDGVYIQRANPAEATWIADIVRDLLIRQTGLSIGVVAFSEAQQGEIEQALDRLAAADPTFATAYDLETSREEDGQAVSLFVKNLENVQGDERDIMIMSVCYAAGPDGRMRMNFGPINNSGGEKRLNVIFSRARQHMVILSSIEPTAITNTYNDGANTLGSFLRYADAVSVGDIDAMTAALGSIASRPTAPTTTTAIVDQLAHALEDAGVEVTRSLGRSGFRCDLALRRPGTPAYVTAVLVDTSARLDSATSEQRRTIQPAVLTAAGWRVEQVTATEWLDRPSDVVSRLISGLRPDSN